MKIHFFHKNSPKIHYIHLTKVNFLVKIKMKVLDEVVKMNFETENIEFKVKYTEDLYKEIIAFANTDGGTVYIGIDNNGNVVGVDNLDEEYTKVTNGIRDAIMPDMTMFIKYSIDDGKIIKISVGEGAYKPYYLKGKGLKPNGVYVRQGTSSVQATFDKIRDMIKNTDGDEYEQMRSMEQEFTFENAKKAFNKYGVEFEENKYRTLGIKTQDGIFTNLATILSDQCKHTIKIAVFDDESNTIFKDNKEFDGSIFKQLEEAYSYLALCNKTEYVISGLERIEISEYPQIALREALVNAIVHRDYSYSGSIIINVNQSQMEFISIGGLPVGLSYEDIMNGISQPRNKRLADIFHRLHLVEAYGTGIRRIFKNYENSQEKPKIEITQNSFKLILPNMRNVLSDKSSTLSPQEQEIIKYVTKNGSISDGEIQTLLNIKKTRAYILIKAMKEKNLLYAQGRGENKRYFKKI